jgi:hypothetical protein
LFGWYKDFPQYFPSKYHQFLFDIFFLCFTGAVAYPLELGVHGLAFGRKLTVRSTSSVETHGEELVSKLLLQLPMFQRVFR